MAGKCQWPSTLTPKNLRGMKSRKMHMHGLYARGQVDWVTSEAQKSALKMRLSVAWKSSAGCHTGDSEEALAPSFSLA